MPTLKQQLTSLGLTDEVVEELASLVEAVADAEEHQMGLVDALRQQGFTPTENRDEDFPPFKGEYKAVVSVIRPENTDGIKDRYHAQFKITQTLSGDVADNRVLLRNYRFGGTNFDGSAITEQQATEAIKQLANDAKTCGVDLDLASDATFEASLAKWLNQECYIRAWYFSPQAEPDRRIQQFIVKRQQDLRRDAKASQAGGTSRTPC